MTLTLIAQASIFGVAGGDGHGKTVRAKATASDKAPFMSAAKITCRFLTLGDIDRDPNNRGVVNMDAVRRIAAATGIDVKIL